VKCDTAFGVSVNNGDARNPVCAISRARVKSASRQPPVIWLLTNYPFVNQRSWLLLNHNDGSCVPSSHLSSNVVRRAQISWGELLSSSFFELWINVKITCRQQESTVKLYSRKIIWKKSSLKIKFCKTCCQAIGSHNHRSFQIIRRLNPYLISCLFRLLH